MSRVSEHQDWIISANLPPSAANGFWELGSVRREVPRNAATRNSRRNPGFLSVMLEWGSCGKIAYVGRRTGRIYALRAAHSTCPARSPFRKAGEPDAVLLWTAQLLESSRAAARPDARPGDAKDLTRSRRAGHEAFGDRRGVPGLHATVDYLRAVGSRRSRPHNHYKRLGGAQGNRASPAGGREVALEGARIHDAVDPRRLRPYPGTLL